MALDEPGLKIDVRGDGLGLIINPIHPEIVGELLELALTTLVADGAIQGMVDEDELHQLFANGLDPLGVGNHLLPLGHVSGAGRKGPRGPRSHFHHAEAARANGLEGRVVAEVRNEDAILLSDFENGFTWLRLNGPTVNGEVNHKSFLSVGNSTIVGAAHQI
jgi:hypothetical protein